MNNNKNLSREAEIIKKKMHQMEILKLKNTIFEIEK